MSSFIFNHLLQILDISLNLMMGILMVILMQQLSFILIKNYMIKRWRIYHNIKKEM